MRFVVVTLVGLVSFAATARASAAPRALDEPSRLRVTEVLGQLPIRFEENMGQVDPAVRYVARSRGYDLFLTTAEAVVVLRDSSPDLESAVVRMRLIGARPSPRLTALDPLPGTTHYLVGNDPSSWRPGLMSYSRVRVQDAYPGIDVVYYGNERQLEYDLVVAPGVDPTIITLGFTGPERLEVGAEGDLIAHVAGRQLRMRKPLVYQDHAGARREVLGRYELQGRDRVGFRVGAYDASQPLVIDPVLLYSTYLGGNGDDTLTGVAVDSSGHVYVAGYTYATDYPTTPGALQPHRAGGTQRDAFVTKLAPDGTLVYSTYLGGTNDDTASGIAIDSLGRAWLVGSTWSTDFPTPNPPPATPAGRNGFVVQLTADGSALTHSRLLGGSRNDDLSRIAIDASGSIYLSGSTTSADFPTTNPVQANCAVPWLEDVFLVKLDANGTNLVYATCLGGTGFESLVGIGVDVGGNLYVGGETASVDFPTLNPVQAHGGGGPYGRDAFLAKLDAGGALVYSTYLGGYGYENEQFYAFTVDAAGNAYMAGATGSSNFPTANAVQSTCAGSMDGFVTKLDGQGAFVYSTYLGGSNIDRVQGLATDAAGNAYLTGLAYSTNFPTTRGVLQPLPGQAAAFVTKLSPTGALAYSTYLGGSGNAAGSDLAVDPSGSVSVTGYSRSTDFPTPPADWPPCPGQGGSFAQNDAFVAKLNIDATALVYSVCLGGINNDNGLWVALDAGGNAYVAGSTQSTDFPTTPDAPQRTFGGGWRDAFVARIGEVQPPTVAAGGPYAVDEGSSTQLTATGSDPQGLDLIYDWDLEGDGTFEFPNAGPTVPYSALGIDGPHTATVTVRVTNTANLAATATATVDVVNVAPTATFTATPAQVIAGQCVTLALVYPDDPGVEDTATGFRYAFDCDGDGVFDVEGSPTPTFVCHATASPGLIPVAAIADDDGGTTRYGATVVVLTAQDTIQQTVVTTVTDLVASGVLNAGQGNALIVSAEAAMAALDAGDVQTALNVLGALLNKLDADVKTGKVPPEIGELLTTVVEQTIAVLQATSGGGDGSCPAV